MNDALKPRETGNGFSSDGGGYSGSGYGSPSIISGYGFQGGGSENGNGLSCGYGAGTGVSTDE